MSINRKKIAIIFGASRGIGAQTAFQLSKSGYSVCIVSRTLSSETKNIPESLKSQGTLEHVQKLIQSSGGEVLSIQCDVRDEKQIENVFKQCLEFFNTIKLELVIYNSGAIHYGDVQNTSLQKFDLLQSVNIRGCYIVLNKAIPYLKDHNFQSRIIVISPPIYQRFLKGKTAYSIGKFAMTALVKGLSFELQNTNVSIVSLWPATGIHTAATERFRNSVKNGEYNRLLRKPNIFADAIVGITRDDQIRNISGNALIDEDYLRERWDVKDFQNYRMDKDYEPPRMMPRKFPDLKVEEENAKPVFNIKKPKL